MAHIAMGNLLSCTVLATFPVLTHLSIIITYASSLTFPQAINEFQSTPGNPTHEQNPIYTHTPVWPQQLDVALHFPTPPVPPPSPNPQASGGNRARRQASGSGNTISALNRSEAKRKQSFGSSKTERKLPGAAGRIQVR